MKMDKMTSFTINEQFDLNLNFLE